MTRRTRFSLVLGFVALSAAIVLEAQAPAGGRGQEPAGGRGRGQVQLPEGAGREIIQRSCTSCHGANVITGSSGFDRAGWHSLISTMVRLPDADMAAVSDYLATHFPEKPGRRPRLVAGDVTVTFREWIVPTLGQRPRDPLQLQDGTIWWAGMYASLIGRLNPTTGAMREFKLAPDARPHSIMADRAGQIWYTGNGNATIGKLDPATGAIDVFPMPDPVARDPHTLIFDPQGTLWFTVQGGNMVGRLNPATREIKLVTMPTANARPYGIVIDSKGAPWVCYNASNKIARIDPALPAKIAETLSPSEISVEDGEVSGR